MAGYMTGNTFSRGVAKAHSKQIVLYAKENNLPSILVAEDDVKFTYPGHVLLSGTGTTFCMIYILREYLWQNR